MPQDRLFKLLWLSVAAAVATIALKTVAWLLTGSVGLLSDAAESSAGALRRGRGARGLHRRLGDQPRGRRTAPQDGAPGAVDHLRGRREAPDDRRVDVG